MVEKDVSHEAKHCQGDRNLNREDFVELSWFLEVIVIDFIVNYLNLL